MTLAAVMSGFRWSMTQILLQVSVLTKVIQMFLNHMFLLFLNAPRANV